MQKSVGRTTSFWQTGLERKGNCALFLRPVNHDDYIRMKGDLNPIRVKHEAGTEGGQRWGWHRQGSEVKLAPTGGQRWGWHRQGVRGEAGTDRGQKWVWHWRGSEVRLAPTGIRGEAGVCAGDPERWDNVAPGDDGREQGAGSGSAHLPVCAAQQLLPHLHPGAGAARRQHRRQPQLQPRQQAARRQAGRVLLCRGRNCCTCGCWCKCRCLLCGCLLCRCLLRRCLLCRCLFSGVFSFWKGSTVGQFGMFLDSSITAILVWVCVI